MARISYIAPSTLQQVQIERVAKNSKPRIGFEFSYTPPATTTPTVPSRLPSHDDAIHPQLCRSFWVCRIAVVAVANYVG